MLLNLNSTSFFRRVHQIKKWEGPFLSWVSWWIITNSFENKSNLYLTYLTFMYLNNFYIIGGICFWLARSIFHLVWLCFCYLHLGRCDLDLVILLDEVTCYSNEKSVISPKPTFVCLWSVMKFKLSPRREPETNTSITFRININLNLNTILVSCFNIFLCFPVRGSEFYDGSGGSGDGETSATPIRMSLFQYFS